MFQSLKFRSCSAWPMPHGLLNALSRRERDDDGGNSKDGGLVGRQDVTTNRILVLVFDFQFSTMLIVFKSRRSSDSHQASAGDSSSIRG